MPTFLEMVRRNELCAQRLECRQLLTYVNDKMRLYCKSFSAYKVETMMPQHSSMHFYLNWAKERIDEMDATLASLEAKAGQVQADSKVKAEQVIADLYKRRDEFEDIIKKHVEANEAAWARAKPNLDVRWTDFEALVKTYVDSFGKKLEEQQATFRDVAAAQLKAWREAAEKIHGAAAELAAGRRAGIDAAVKQMKADSSEAEARLKQVGADSWAAFSKALAESRAAFDRANQATWEALKRAAPPKT